MKEFSYPAGFSHRHVPVANAMWRQEVNKEHYRQILSNCALFKTKRGNTEDFLLPLIMDGTVEIPLMSNTVNGLLNQWEKLRHSYKARRESSHISLVRVTEEELLGPMLKLVNELRIHEYAQAYFDSPSVTISDVYVMDAKRYVKDRHERVDGAGMWHRDSMGRSLKLFIPLEYNGFGISTFVAKGSNIVSPLPLEWEMLRANPQLSYDNKLQITRVLSEYWHAKVYEHKSSSRSALVFDTNSFHRGSYFSEEGDMDDSRIHIQCTLSSDANMALYSMLPGHGISSLNPKTNISRLSGTGNIHDHLAHQQFQINIQAH